MLHDALRVGGAMRADALLSREDRRCSRRSGKHSGDAPGRV